MNQFDVSEPARTAVEDPASNPAAEVFAKLERLYEQSEAVKMIGLQKFLGAGRESGDEGGAELLKLSQLVLKAIELQLRIINEFSKSGLKAGGEFPSELSELWEAMLEVPALGALLRRAKVREDLVKRLKARERGA